MAQAYDICDIACSKLLMESLRTHLELNDISLDNIVRTVCGRIDRDAYVMFIVLTNRVVGLGRWAWIHNKIVDTYIRRGDVQGLLGEIGLGRRMFREVFENPLMTEMEVSVINSVIDSECSVIRGMIDNYESYDHCKEMICLVSGGMPSELCTSPSLYVADTQGTVPEVYCVNKHDLIVSLATGSKINPQTGTDFTPSTYNMLMSRYQKEIKICYHAMRYIGNV
jgi:hypothetical protein